MLWKVEAVEVHYFIPNRDKIFNELLLRIVLSVDLCEGAEFGVGAKGEIHSGASPLYLAGFAVVSLIETTNSGGFPVDIHIGEMNKEVICQDAWFIGEHPVLGVTEVSIEHTHAADEGGHFR